MKKITIHDIEYEILEDENKIVSLEEVESLMTDYFFPYDYILGDYSYGKLRLKGFYDNSNKKANKINKFSYLKSYIEDYCAYSCKYFVIKKIKN